MVDRHGDEAAIKATMRADEYFAAGNMDGRAVWHRIEVAIVEMQRLERG